MRNRFTTFCDLEIFTGSRREFVDLFVRDRQMADRARTVFSVNGQGLSEFSTNRQFRGLYGRADYIHADGMSIVFGTRLCGREPCRERIATTDWFHDVVRDERCRDVRHFLLGADQDSLAAAVQRLHRLYPAMIIAGARHGYFAPEEEQAIVAEINRADTDILWLGLGRPKQERFAVQWRDQLTVTWIKTCGGLFDFLAGKNRRAPVWMQNTGLEWAYRLGQEPTRLFSRYLKTNCIAAAVMLREGWRNLRGRNRS